MVKWERFLTSVQMPNLVVVIITLCVCDLVLFGEAVKYVQIRNV